MALAYAAYVRLLPRLWQEMLMEHVGIIKWAHHKIMWPSQGFARRAVIFFDITARTRWHIGTRDTNYTNVLFTLKAGEVLESMGGHVPDCVCRLDKHLI